MHSHRAPSLHLRHAETQAADPLCVCVHQSLPVFAAAHIPAAAESLLALPTRTRMRATLQRGRTAQAPRKLHPLAQNRLANPNP